MGERYTVYKVDFRAKSYGAIGKVWKSRLDSATIPTARNHVETGIYQAHNMQPPYMGVHSFPLEALVRLDLRQNYHFPTKNERGIQGSKRKYTSYHHTKKQYMTFAY